LDLQKDYLKERYGVIDCFRLTKNDKPLNTVKIRLEAEDKLRYAVRWEIYMNARKKIR
jgi:hypothetical protein